MDYFGPERFTDAHVKRSLCLNVHSVFPFLTTGEGEKAKNAKDEARELQLKEEAAVRMNVRIIQENISLVLRALGAAAAANPSYSHEQLPLLVSFGRV